MLEDVKQCDEYLYDASNNKMDIIGTVSAVEVVNSKKPVRHDFHVLNKETYSTILLGRDFMRKVDEVSLNIKDNAVKIRNVWVKGVQISRMCA